MYYYHYNLKSEHMIFKVEKIAYVSGDSTELIGNQRSLSWYAKQEWGRRAAKCLGKWLRWTTERGCSISNISSRRCINALIINFLVYISRGMPTETWAGAWLYPIPTGVQVLHIMFYTEKGKTKHTVPQITIIHVWYWADHQKAKEQHCVG